ncbi:MAG TPA: hypothetical protein VK503_01745 [Candidatus Bathyarchaeia archaeon]|nr:hypothetical protein [Candidatus Bathyarchaeia archaeon]
MKIRKLADINTSNAKYYILAGVRVVKVDLIMVFSLIAGGALACATATAGKAGALACATATAGKGAFFAHHCLPNCLPAVGAWGGVKACGYGAYHGCLPAAGAWSGAQAFGYWGYHGCLPATGWWGGAQIFCRVPCVPCYW